MHLEPLRTTLATTSKLLRRNKAFLRNQMSSLLALNLDANKHFKSRSRCCPRKYSANPPPRQPSPAGASA
jgi:hypothetical protein